MTMMMMISLFLGEGLGTLGFAKVAPLWSLGSPQPGDGGGDDDGANGDGDGGDVVVKSDKIILTNMMLMVTPAVHVKMVKLMDRWTEEGLEARQFFQIASSSPLVFHYDNDH